MDNTKDSLIKEYTCMDCGKTEEYEAYCPVNKWKYIKPARYHECTLIALEKNSDWKEVVYWKANQ